jgi:hypothetical protein
MIQNPFRLRLEERVIKTETKNAYEKGASLYKFLPDDPYQPVLRKLRVTDQVSHGMLHPLALATLPIWLDHHLWEVHMSY